MKKVMIGILVLIPIIIMITVGAVTSFVTARAHISVEEIRFEFDDGEEKQLELEFGRETYDLSSLLTVTVLPERASDKSFTWRIDDLNCYDDDYNVKWQNGEVEAPAYLVDENGNEVEENSTGLLKVNSYCYFNVYVQAETMSDKCLVYVGGSEVKGVTVKGTQALTRGQSVLFEAVSSPIDALVEKTEWISSNPAVATVDGNGVVTAVGAGTCFVTAKAYGKTNDGKTPQATSPNFEVTVSGGASAFGGFVKVHQNGFTLSDLGVNSVVENYSNCVINAGAVTITDTAQPAIINTENGSVSVQLVGENAIEIRNAQHFAFDASKENGFILAVSDMLSVDAVFASRLKDGSPSAVFTSSNSDVAAIVDNKYVRGLKSGTATITATYSVGGNDYTATLLLAVENKITNLILDTTDASLAVGLARETVFASRLFDNVSAGTFKNNSFEIVFKRPTPEVGTETVFYSAYNFSVKDVTDGTEKDTTKAYFEDNKIVFNATEITDTVLLKVTVTAKYPKYHHLSAYTSKSFTLKVIDGVAVGTDAEIKKAGELNVDVALYSNIFITNPGGLSDKRDEMIVSNFSIYGNNKMISSKVEQFKKRDSLMFLLRGDDSVVSNLIIRVNEDIGEEISNGDEDMAVLLGVGIRFEGRKQLIGQENNLDSFRMEYTIIENCRTCINVLAAKVDCEGNIMRNCLEMAIWAPTDINSWGGEGVRYFDLTLKNNVFSNLVSLSFSFTYSGYSDKPEYVQAMEEGKNSSLSIIGFLDVYNWQELNVLSMIPTSAVGDDLASYVPLINTVLRDELVSGAFFDEYRYNYNGVTYFHMGGMGTGLIEPCYLNLVRNDETRFKEFTSENFKNASGAMSIVGNMELVRVWCYTNNVKGIIPQSKYIVNNKLIDRLHGIGVEYPEGTPEYAAQNA